MASGILGPPVVDVAQVLSMHDFILGASREAARMAVASGHGVAMIVGLAYLGLRDPDGFIARVTDQA
jgi:hypothetical protein